MSYIKFINERNQVSYDTEQDIENCIAYIFNICKTAEDEIRPGHMIGDFVGCSHFFGTRAQEMDANWVSVQMFANNNAYAKTKNNLLKHRVISFSRYDDVMPNEAFQLAKYIANLYGERYITAYGVHLDTDAIHIHFAIDTISWLDGRRFSESYEYRWLYAIVRGWEQKRNEMLVNKPTENERRCQYFGW